MSALDECDSSPGFGNLREIRRVDLPDGAWVDVFPGWAHHSAPLFHELAERVPWHTYERMMYGRAVPVPRLIKNYDEGEAFPHPRLTEAMHLLNSHYAAAGEHPRTQFTRAGLNLYRDGSDSAAWHSDTGAAADEDDTMVAILALGAPRTLSVRPRGGWTSQRFNTGNGDLLVMGGSFQRTHQHSVGKAAGVVGSRVSVQYRPTWASAGSDRLRFVRKS